MKSDALAPAKPIQIASLEPSWPKIVPNVGLLYFLLIWGAILESKIIQKSIPKSRHVQASLETLFFTIGTPKSAKTSFQN